MKFLADIKDTFGTISPPPAIKDFIGADTTGAAGISKFLSNLVTLIYSLAAIVLIFMLLWGAFEWIISGGDKEKLSSAQKKIINAIIGIVLLAVTFAVITVLGQFTGFKFFKGQGVTITGRDSRGNIIQFVCPNGTIVQTSTTDPALECQQRGLDK